MTVKEILLGATAQIIAKSVSHIVAQYLKANGVDFQSYIWYKELDPRLPPVDDIVLDLVVPTVLILADRRTRDAGIGAGLTGSAVFVHQLILRNEPVVS